MTGQDESDRVGPGQRRVRKAPASRRHTDDGRPLPAPPLWLILTSHRMAGISQTSNIEQE